MHNETWLQTITDADSNLIQAKTSNHDPRQDYTIERIIEISKE